MPLWRKLAYSFGNIGTSLSYQAVSAYAQFFYVDVMKLAPPLMGAAMIVYAIWNAINDPLAGYLSDRTRTRWGRRIPYILFLSLPLAICFALLWLPPVTAAQNQALLLAYFLFAIFMFDGLFTFVALNMTALFPEMFPSLDERAQVSAYRQLFALVGMVLGVALPPIIYAGVGWGAMGIGFGALTALSLYASLFGMRESGARVAQEALTLRDALAATFRNRSFVAYIAFQIMREFAFLLIVAAIPFYAKYVLRTSEGITSLLLFAAFGVAFPMVMVWGKIIPRLGARNAMSAALGLFAVTLTPLLFVNTVEATLLTTGALGIALAGLFILPDIMLADVIDEDELKTGRRREGMYFGVQGLLLRAAIALQAIALNVILTLSGYNAALPVDAQPPMVEAGLRAIVSIAPISALLLAMVCLRWYPLHGTRLAEIVRARGA